MTRRTAREMAQDRLATAKRKREAVEARIVRAGAELRAGTPDVDKALRATFDALTEAGIWRDDKLVAQVTASKVYGVRPGARIHVEPIGGAS